MQFINEDRTEADLLTPTQSFLFLPHCLSKTYTQPQKNQNAKHNTIKKTVP